MTTQTKKSIGSTRRMTLTAAFASVATVTILVALDTVMPAAAYAAEAAEFRSEKVRFHDLDLRTEAGVAKLHKRIHRAARHVCAVGVLPQFRAYTRKSTCVKETARNGQAKADQKIAQHRMTRLEIN